MKTPLICLLIGTSVFLTSQAQTFNNLHFEKALVRLNNPDYGALDWSLAVPGWSHSTGSSTSIVYYKQGHVGVDPIYLLMSSVSPEWAPGTQLSGNYSLAFASGNSHNLGFTTNWWTEASISQTGAVPAYAQSLRMMVTGPFKVLVDGTEIRMTHVDQEDPQVPPLPPLPPGYSNLYAGSVSKFAGKTVELKIVNTAVAWTEYHRYTVVDDIVFSSLPAPAPAQLSLASPVAGSIRIAWPTNLTDYQLETTPLLPATTWNPVTNSPVVDGDAIAVQLPTTDRQRLYRLRKP